MGFSGPAKAVPLLQSPSKRVFCPVVPFQSRLESAFSLNGGLSGIEPACHQFSHCVEGFGIVAETLDPVDVRFAAEPG